MHLFDLIPHGIQFNIPLTTIINYIPVVATVVTCVLSIVLARATLRYAEASDKSLALAREEFEREWSPELHIKLERVSAKEARIVVTNLAKLSVLLQLVQWRRISHAVPFERHPVNDPLLGGTTWTHNIGPRLLACTGDDFEGTIAASVTFYASGRLFRTDWFRFQAQVSNGNILRLDPITVPARRVQVLDARGTRSTPAPRRELVKDVTGELLAATKSDD